MRLTTPLVAGIDYRENLLIIQVRVNRQADLAPGNAPRPSAIADHLMSHVSHRGLIWNEDRIVLSRCDASACKHDKKSSLRSGSTLTGNRCQQDRDSKCAF